MGRRCRLHRLVGGLGTDLLRARGLPRRHHRRAAVLDHQRLARHVGLLHCRRCGRSSHRADHRDARHPTGDRTRRRPRRREPGLPRHGGLTHRALRGLRRACARLRDGRSSPRHHPRDSLVSRSPGTCPCHRLDRAVRRWPHLHPGRRLADRRSRSRRCIADPRPRLRHLDPCHAAAAGPVTGPPGLEPEGAENAANDGAVDGIDYDTAIRTRFFVVVLIGFVLAMGAQVGGLSQIANLGSERVDSSTGALAVSAIAVGSASGASSGASSPTASRW